MGLADIGAYRVSVREGATILREHRELAAFLTSVCPTCADALADRLIARFGAIGAILAADPAALAHALPDALPAVDLICSARRVMLSSLMREISARPLFEDGKAVIDYLHARLAHEKCEMVWAMFLDAKLVLLAEGLISTGSIREVRTSPREVIRRALEVGAVNLIVAHNHPSGDPAPSQADIGFTRALSGIAGQMDISLQDHLIVTRTGWTSLRAEGLLL